MTSRTVKAWSQLHTELEDVLSQETSTERAATGRLIYSNNTFLQMEAACQNELDFLMQATNKELAEKTGRSINACLLKHSKEMSVDTPKRQSRTSPD